MAGAPINVLLIGGGGREHALAWRLAQSPRVGHLYAAPGNPGIAAHAALVLLDPSDQEAVVRFCRANDIGLVVVGPEGPLVAGLIDAVEAAGILAFGPSKAAAALEGSKGFTKDLAAAVGIPTAGYCRCTDLASARAEIARRGAPLVVKADGLASGKGVTVAMTSAEALAAVEACFAGAFGTAGAEVVIEDFLEGTEASLFALSDGRSVVSFGSAQDYKRLGDGDHGPNTGGMGAVSPAPALTAALTVRAMEEIIRPTIAALAARGMPYGGVLYAGLMLTRTGPKLIEYNVRFGDPECQVLMMRLRSDLLDVLLATAEGRLAEVALDWSPDPAVTVVMAAPGYPAAPQTGGAIAGLDAAEAATGARIFHAGTALQSGRLVASGGRVLNVTASGTTIAEARERAYRAVAAVDWPEGVYRRDIAEETEPRRVPSE